MLTVLIVDLGAPSKTADLRTLHFLLKSRMKIVLATHDSEPRGDIPQALRILRIPPWQLPWPRRFFTFAKTLIHAAKRPGNGLRFLKSAIQAGGTWKERVQRAYELLPFVDVKVDVVHFDSESAAVALFPLFELLDCSFVINFHGADANPVLRRALEKAHVVYSVSRAAEQRALGMGLDPQKVRVMKPVVDEVAFKPSDRRPSDGSAFRVVATGRIAWENGLEYLLVAVRRVVETGLVIRLEIVGAGRANRDEMQRLLYTIDDLSLNSSVILQTTCDPERVAAVVCNADVFVLPSLTEEASNSILEAMACGLPVVTTDSEFHREVLSEGIEGFFVPVRRPDVMAEMLIRLAGDKDLRERAGAASRARVMREFTVERHAAEIVSLYRVVMAGPRLSPR